MTQEGRYLPLVEVKVEILQSHFAIRVNLVKVINGDSCNHYRVTVISQLLTCHQSIYKALLSAGKGNIAVCEESEEMSETREQR